MKLNEYAVELMNAIRTNTDGKPVTITLSPEDMAYREVIGLALYDAICGTGVSHSLECMSHRYHAINAALLEVRNRLKIAEEQAAKPIKPKREIQKAPKRGNIPKAKIERAVKEVKDADKK